MIRIWKKVNEFRSPLVATAIHNGHELRSGIKHYLAIDEYDRLREEDPYTEYFTDVAMNQLIVNTSRFEVDVNRPREGAVYRTPEQSWGLNVWKKDAPVSVWEYSLQEYDFFYSLLDRLISKIVDYWGYVIVYDIHSYNHRRRGRNEKEDDPEENPDVNIGTGSMDRKIWSPVVDRFISVIEDCSFQGRKLHVAENIRFKGGYMANWIHTRFPGKSCVLSIEFKKIFMDEWTGAVDLLAIHELKKALNNTVLSVLNAANMVIK